MAKTPKPKPIKVTIRFRPFKDAAERRRAYQLWVASFIKK